MSHVADRILMIQLYSNGDCLYATAVARQIKKDFPGCHLTWAIASFCKDIILNNPDVDEILEVSTVPKNNVTAFRKFKKSILQKKSQGEYNLVFNINNIDTNQCYYDGTIRGNILKAYPGEINVSLQPVLHLFQSEIERVNNFVSKHCLKNYSKVILFEFAPQSGQSKITKEDAMEISEQITGKGNYAVIMSSSMKIVTQNPAIIDGSSLTIRETAYLTNFCTFLLGTSSGITWASTSDCGKVLPMVQLLNPFSRWSNSVSRDFDRFQIPNQGIIEIWDLKERNLIDCVLLALNDFKAAHSIYNQPLPVHFKTTRSIVYNLLCYLEFKAIFRHIQINLDVYGFQFQFFREVLLGFVIFPFKLVKNIWTKHL
jgi:hypothetical protein